MSDMSPLVAWLREAMDAAERAVQALPPGPWRRAEVENAEEERVDLVSGADTQAVLSAAWVWRHDRLDAYLPLLQPDAVLRRIAADRKLLDDLLAEKHQVVEGDCWYTCAAATEERDGGETCDDSRLGKPCDCGRDARIARRVLLLAEGWGRSEEEQR